ncbi:hypothetical protein H5410_033901 [Solanum commersonii]|uniref:Agenet domain-containing protein n=1 Tax=Solanum commersonii TaxID=4109 RepID=A0A9J5YP60_SOLCO|nr:hypothetical protein H5410_033901 [Solanum commersonii]
MFTSAAIRPVPPHQDETMSENGFRLYDMVDVFANDGWWFGFISGKIGEEYYVYFPTTADNIAYTRHVLRFSHFIWSNGKWIVLPRQGKIFPFYMSPFYFSLALRNNVTLLFYPYLMFS